MTSKSHPPRLLSPTARTWLAKLGLATGAPLFFFLSLELVLRLAGVGQSTDFFVPDDQPGYYRTNLRFTDSFFPPSFGLTPLSFRLQKEKPAGVLRIFVLGESAAMGMPEPGFGLTPQLHAQLKAAHPDKRFEVHNLTITAINSHVILKIARQAVQFDPDLLVIYMGNNEVVGPYGPGSLPGNFVPPAALVRASLWIRSTRTAQLLLRLVRPKPASENWTGMETFADKVVAADDPRLESVYNNFADNLAAILAVAHDAGVKTVVSTVAVNLRDSAPFHSATPAGWTAAQLSRWQAMYDRAIAAADATKLAEARALLEQALESAPQHAATHFLLARVLEQQDAPAARRHYLEALRLDGLRFRADGQINHLIRSAVQRAGAGAFLLDAARLLGSDPESAGPPAGRELFFEHVHFNWNGNWQLARLVAGAVHVSLFGTAPPPAAWLDSSQCAEEVGYTDVGHLNILRTMTTLTGRPPFTKQFSYPTDRTLLEKTLAAATQRLAQPGVLAAAAATIERARQRHPENQFLLFQAEEIESALGHIPRALELNAQLAATQPPSPAVLARRGFLLKAARRHAEAETALLAAARDFPYYYGTYNLLLQLWHETGEINKAIDYFGALVKAMPGNRVARLNYAQLLALNGSGAAAEQEWRTVLATAPDNEDALAALARAYDSRGKISELLPAMQRAFAYNPRSFPNNLRLLQMAEDEGDLPRQVMYLQAMAGCGGVSATLHLDLAARLEKLGRPEEALAALWNARATALAENDGPAVREAEALIRGRDPAAVFK